VKISSPEFGNMQDIPAKFTCQGEDINPPLKIEDVPEHTESLVLIMDDPDSPTGTWDHWVVWNIAPSTKEIPEHSKPGVEGMNTWPKLGYGGPCPASGKHRYVFTLYALDTTLDLPATSTKKDVESEMEHHILEKTELIGLFEKS